MPNLRFKKDLVLVGGGTCKSISWNSGSAFDAKVVVVMLVHNNGWELIRAVDSVLEQVTTTPFALLIIDDSSTSFWEKQLGYRLNDDRVVVAQAISCKAWQARNLAHRLVWSEFPNHEWICRIDGDDQFASDRAIENTLDTIKQSKPEAMWALGGNLLEEDGRLLSRDNRTSQELLEIDGLLHRLEGMHDNIAAAELPSCNLWIRNGFRCHYPEMDSAEDHWLVAHLLSRYSEYGCLLPDVLHAVYNLSGKLTMSNRKRGQYRKSRKLLYRSVLNWIGHEVGFEEPICLGWGGEGAVWLENGIVRKRFYDNNLTDEQAAWLGQMKSLGHLPDAKWTKIEDRWEAHYRYVDTEAVTNVTLPAISCFIGHCLDKGIVCLNITRRNFRMIDGELYFVDLGRDILPLEVRYFRDMCARLYLLFVKKLLDLQLASRTLKIRNNIGQMRSIDGFESFYHRENHRWFLSHGFFAKPFRDLKKQKRFHHDITLLIKCCAMETDLIYRQVHHIIAQLCEHDRFAEILLLIDPKDGQFLRQYKKGNLSELLEKVNGLREEDIISRILLSPDQDQKNVISTTNERWFGMECNETHTTNEIPVFPQLWGFEQVKTRYVLQMDADVIIRCSSNEHNVIGEMKKALQQEKVFSVGFNIPQLGKATFKKYDAPDGSYVPEVRLGLLDLERILGQRPFPNSVVEGKLELTWYRSIEQYQNDMGWRSLRGGNPCSYYIHPPNLVKNEPTFLDRVVDLVEQNRIPSIQRSKWDLIGTPQDWQYPKRIEPIVVLIIGKNPGIHWARSCLLSLLQQDGVEWGALIIDDGSAPHHQRWLDEYTKDYQDKITLVRCRFQDLSEQFIHDILSEVCIDPDQLIIRMGADEVFFSPHVLKKVQEDLTEEHRNVWGATYLSRYPLGLDITSINENSVGNIDEYNVPIALRGIRLRELENNNSHFLNIQTVHGERPIQIEDDSILVHGYLFYNNQSLFTDSQSNILRPTTYIPNVRRIEIDITYDCNLRCPGCSRSSSQAPSQLHMPMEMIHNFLKETERRGIKWESVHILGGEPTLHPRFLEIIKDLNDWFEENSPLTDLKVISNGTGEKVRRALDNIPKRWLYENSFKNGRNTGYFEPFNMAPIDVPTWRDEDFRKGCYITQDSGIGLTPFGYFHCGIAGGIERIIGLGLGFKDLPEHPWEFIEMMSVYCQYCGHFLNDTFHNKSEQLAKGVSPDTMSEAWKKAYKKWLDNSIG